MAASRESARIAADTEEAPELFRSALLVEVLAPLIRGEAWSVLDLGPSWASTFAYLSDFRCRLGVADALRTLAAMGSEAEEQSAEDRSATWRSSLLPPSEEGWNAVLAWELFDYLPPALITECGERLAEVLAPGGCLHALTMSERSHIPAVPRHYELRALERVAVHTAPAASMATPRHGQGVLRRCLPGFSIEHSRLHLDGRQEHLLIYRG